MEAEESEEELEEDEELRSHIMDTARIYEQG